MSVVIGSFLFEDTTSVFGSFQCIAYNGSYYLTGGQSGGEAYIAKYANDVLISSVILPHKKDYDWTSKLGWNGLYWLVATAYGYVYKYDGTSITEDLSDAFGLYNFPDSRFRGCSGIKWNGLYWIVYCSSPDGVFKYDGTTVSKYQLAIGPMDDWTTFGNNNPGAVWLLGGHAATLFKYNGTGLLLTDNNCVDWVKKEIPKPALNVLNTVAETLN